MRDINLYDVAGEPNKKLSDDNQSDFYAGQKNLILRSGVNLLTVMEFLPAESRIAAEFPAPKA